MSWARITVTAKTTATCKQTRNLDLVGGRGGKGGDRVVVDWFSIVKFRKRNLRVPLKHFE